MEFHEYQLTRHVNAPREIAGAPISEFYAFVEDRIRSGIDSGRGFSDQKHLWLTEIGYVKSKRPFYNVYPAVELCLENTKLDFKLKQIEPLDQVISLCFAVGKEPVLSNGKAAAMLVEFRHTIEDPGTEGFNDPLLRMAVDVIGLDGTRRFWVLAYAGDELLSETTDQIGDKKKLVSLAVGVILLAKDERFVEPILLSRDQGKQLDETGLKRAIARAKARGRNGFAIGKGLEVSPHMRRPHFAIRWTGQGRIVPRLVPVKGCVVNRNKLFPVPTGHLDN